MKDCEKIAHQTHVKVPSFTVAGVTVPESGANDGAARRLDGVLVEGFHRFSMAIMPTAGILVRVSATTGSRGNSMTHLISHRPLLSVKVTSCFGIPFDIMTWTPREGHWCRPGGDMIRENNSALEDLRHTCRVVPPPRLITRAVWDHLPPTDMI